MTFVTRFAPSPTGLLHRGHAFSALTAFAAAREVGGRFLLRIEDIDATRCRPDYDAAIGEDLAWLGLAWETPVRRQSRHLAEYHAAIETLRERGLVYRCFKTRKEIDIGRAPHEPAAPYVGAPLAADEEAERLARGEPFAWRLSLAAARAALDGFEGLTFVEEGAGPDGETGLIQARPETAGDIVLARKDVGVAYHLAVVHDDALQGVTHVIRGRDLFEAAHIQRLLQALLDLPTPTYRHHGLLVGPDGKRYAKRDKAQTLRELRTAGVSAGELRAELGFP
ncbi:tRNA glutamyl-Q(34) synthetase GluQRS [uncultured Caulobacter sp.]|uniref:tRNA glutamyl-Q(34) synthetase GluQRS n=1 Tax=uncultured Caulobacter sp. TaxID=158749 RepID=UPI002633CB16|nr:tRNA glutamyl-Q(34) synthetase GluQRS [uncultured Caulobacter sp.]